MKPLFPIVVGLVSALRSTLLALRYIDIVDRRPDFKLDRLLNQPQQLQDALANSVKVSLTSLMLLLRDGYHKYKSFREARQFSSSQIANERAL